VLRVGNLDVWRDFLDVRDVARAYLALAAHGVAGVAYNVCSGQTFRIGDLLDGLLQRARVPLRAEVDPERWRPNDLPVLRGDPTRLRAQTGWVPAVGIDAMLDDILTDWRRRTAAEGAP
jgi:GDP-4-dehydro-6-deoxy-D-mannose reductase